MKRFLRDFKESSSMVNEMVDKIRGLMNVRNDLLAGLVVALALIPEAIAFSSIAGLDPKVGLYASFCMATVIAFAGGLAFCQYWFRHCAGHPDFYGPTPRTDRGELAGVCDGDGGLGDYLPLSIYHQERAVPARGYRGIDGGDHVDRVGHPHGRRHGATS